MSDSEARGKLRPRTAADRHQLSKLAVYLLGATLAIAAMYEINAYNHDRIVQTWPNANAKILDARIVHVGWWHSRYGSKLAYDVQVLVSYSAEGAAREKWTTVHQQPRTSEDANLEIFRWKGQTCLVHWNPTNPEEVIADIS